MKTKTYPEIQQFECKECENWMEQQCMNFSPFYILLKCSGCDREIKVQGDLDKIII